MKKISLLLILTIFILSGLLAADSNPPTTILITPYDGVAGIPLGSNMYHSDTKGWWETNYVKNKSNAEKSVNYTDEEMLGIIMFLNGGTIKMDGTVTVTVTCPNGFYLVSESNPNYKRPFEIMLFDSWNAKGSQGHKISDREPTINVPISATYTYSSGWGGGDTNAQFHFDVVLRLPGTTDPESDECKVTENGNSIVYPLGEDLSDYSAVVTFSVTYTSSSGNTNITKNVTVPFTGYYDGTETPYSSDDSVSMSIVLNSDAYNIDIQNKLGQTVNIGYLYFNMMVGSGKTSTTDNCAIFLSSSSDPEDQNAAKFALVKDDIGETEARTSLNSVGFRLTCTSIDPDNSGSTVTFDGSTYFESPSGSGSSITMDNGTIGKRIKYTQVITSDKYIIPTIYKERMMSGNRAYFSYSGSIALELDDNVITMQSGRYIETVYVHVMAYK